MLFEWVRCGTGRCGSRLELALELELGRLADGSSDMLTQLVGQCCLFRTLRRRLDVVQLACSTPCFRAVHGRGVGRV